MSTARVPRRTTLLSLLVLVVTLFWLSPNQAVSQAAAAGAYLYITSENNSQLIVSNLDGTNPVNKGNLGSKLNGPMGIALDVKSQKMYIASNLDHKVIRANLDGSSPTQILVGPPLNYPLGLALDLVHSKIYVANAGRIVKAGLDGSNPVHFTFFDNWNLQPWAIALDTANNHMYVTERGQDKVIRADLDGASPTALDFGSVTLNDPAGIALDFYSQRM